MSYLMAKLRQFDAYNKPLDDFRVKTLVGGMFTLISTIIILLLITSELYDFMQIEIREDIFVDTASDSERVKIKFDVTFPALACEFMSVDAMDVSGDHQDNVEHNVWKISLDRQGKLIENSHQKQEVGKATGSHIEQSTTLKPTPACGSCYGAETEFLKCCSTCDDVKRAYQRRGWVVDEATVEQCKSNIWLNTMREKEGQGCRVYGSIEVSKVAGNFHIAPGRSVLENHAHVHDLRGIQPKHFNVSNVIEHFEFGDTFPDKVFPLNGHESIDLSGGSMFQFYAKSVPTVYVVANGTELYSHQFSVTKHRKSISVTSGDGLPGFFVVYEFAPFVVRLQQWHRPLAHLLTSVCAIVGGVFTVASLLDAVFYNADRLLRAKMEIGKAS